MQQPPATTRRSIRLRSGLLAAGVVVALVLLVGCRTLGYYAHVAHGHADVMSRRQPIAALLDDPATPAALRAQLAPLLEARAFASDRLHLPRNRSYTYFARLDRPFVSWNVFAAPEFSIEPVQHCFPVAGCVGYRGFFERARADAEAARLRGDGFESWIGGVPAYSTLGWFDDPVLSTMPLDRRDQLIGVIFHELAHQRVYAGGDSAFNESYAKFVEQRGLLEWRAEQGLAASGSTLDYRPVVQMILELRDTLAALYAEPIEVDAMRAAKHDAIEAFRLRYLQWRATEGADRPGYDAWIAAPIDNAKLVPFGLYDQWLPAFEQVFADAGNDWQAFHRSVEALADADHAARQRQLDALLARARQATASD